MNQQTKNTAVLIFSQQGGVEARTKRFLGRANHAVNKAICGQLISRTNKVVRQNGLDHFIVDETIQTGSTFGEKLQNAFEFVFSQGFSQVICVGNDCPNLSGADLRRAKQHVENGHLVVGPDRRGGIYLLGMSKEQFQQTSLASFSWQSRDLFNELSSFWKAQVTFLEVKSDLNNGRDLSEWINASLSASPFRTLIRKVLDQITRFYRIEHPTHSNTRLLYAPVGLRAP